MDPISKALEKAKQEQKSVRQWVQPDNPRTQKPVPQPVTEVSKQVSLDPNHLHASNLLCGTVDEDPVVTDRYRLLRTRVLQIMRANGWRSVGITSPGVKAGKTVTSVNLAFSIARDDNYQVTLIDADIRKPSAARYMGVEHHAGLPDFLAQRASLEEIMVGIDTPVKINFVSGQSDSHERPAPDVLKSEQMKSLIEASTAGHEGNLVVVDLPPVLIGDDVIAVAANLDALLLVVDESSTQIDDLKQAVELLAQFNVLGTVLNKSTQKPKKESGYYEYHYYSSSNDDQAGMKEAKDAE